MFLKLLKSKIHRAVITDTKLDYLGSMAIDSAFMDEVGLKPYEAIVVADITNGNRLETYVVPAPAGSKEMSILGAAAKLIQKGDTVIILNYGYYDEQELASHKPSVIVLDENNDIIDRK